MVDRTGLLLAAVGAGVDPAWPILLAVVGGALGLMGAALGIAAWCGWVADGFGRSRRRVDSAGTERRPRLATFWSTNW